MISEQARQGVDLLFTRAVCANLVMNPSDTIDIATLPPSHRFDPPESRIVVFTIASYLFRLLTIFHVDAGKANVDYFARGGSGRPFFEVFGEIGNMCCGAMNRELGRFFPHMGMSTPSVLDRKCLPFIGTLDPAYLAHYRIEINRTASLHATLCLCAYGDIDFRVDPALAEEESGALELF
ncbi:hypothetical protein [Thauera chlorobenzoica]|uniref:Uncharacterized protein n=1 Tax=Thauera chlorobenzoica TaxID=96773 RepID=A0A1H5X8I2_9RHOO|nr:hypothetical protein [Thauera chlorobenzoica]APR04768.1 hypothetical protein Tchl_1921 [Thauera chlorobenzoica]SEG08064.1 hypothetical protein SAMN05216242_11614 [Thauera chlorobenzoica]